MSYHQSHTNSPLTVLSLKLHHLALHSLSYFPFTPLLLSLLPGVSIVFQASHIADRHLFYHSYFFFTSILILTPARSILLLLLLSTIPPRPLLFVPLLTAYYPTITSVPNHCHLPDISVFFHQTLFSFPSYLSLLFLIFSTLPSLMPSLSSCNNLDINMAFCR